MLSKEGPVMSQERKMATYGGKALRAALRDVGSICGVLHRVLRGFTPGSVSLPGCSW